MVSKIKHEPDFDQFLKAITRSGKPSHLPFYEHIASPGFISQRTGVDVNRLTPDERWENYVRFWLEMGFDCIPMEVPPPYKLPPGHNALSESSEAQVVIRTMKDFEEYDWPSEENPIDFSHFEKVAKLLPPGVKIVGGVCRGPYEWAAVMMGTVGLSYALADDPELVELVFRKIGAISLSALRQLATMDTIGALRQGDDLGFKTSTFLSPELLRKFVFPIYKQMAAEAHKNGKPFILHSCGNLADVYEDLIEYCKIDAKHSFEDAIMPVGDFKRQYGNRITPIGGLDVDVICRASEKELRAYARRIIEECFHDGWWVFGTGNSLTDYMPVENYMTVLDEARRI